MDERAFNNASSEHSSGDTAPKPVTSAQVDDIKRTLENIAKNATNRRSQEVLENLETIARSMEKMSSSSRQKISQRPLADEVAERLSDFRNRQGFFGTQARKIAEKKAMRKKREAVPEKVEELIDDEALARKNAERTRRRLAKRSEELKLKEKELESRLKDASLAGLDIQEEIKNNLEMVRDELKINSSRIAELSDLERMSVTRIEKLHEVLQDATAAVETSEKAQKQKDRAGSLMISRMEMALKGLDPKVNEKVSKIVEQSFERTKSFEKAIAEDLFILQKSFSDLNEEVKRAPEKIRSLQNAVTEIESELVKKETERSRLEKSDVKKDRHALEELQEIITQLEIRRDSLARQISGIENDPETKKMMNIVRGIEQDTEDLKKNRELEKTLLEFERTSMRLSALSSSPEVDEIAKRLSEFRTVGNASPEEMKKILTFLNESPAAKELIEAQRQFGKDLKTLTRSASFESLDKISELLSDAVMSFVQTENDLSKISRSISSFERVSTQRSETSLKKLDEISPPVDAEKPVRTEKSELNVLYESLSKELKSKSEGLEFLSGRERERAEKDLKEIREKIVRVSMEMTNSTSEAVEEVGSEYAKDITRFIDFLKKKEDERRGFFEHAREQHLHESEVENEYQFRLRMADDERESERLKKNKEEEKAIIDQEIKDRKTRSKMIMKFVEIEMEAEKRISAYEKRLHGERKNRFKEIRAQKKQEEMEKIAEEIRKRENDEDDLGMLKLEGTDEYVKKIKSAMKTFDIIQKTFFKGGFQASGALSEASQVPNVASALEGIVKTGENSTAVSTLSKMSGMLSKVLHFSEGGVVPGNDKSAGDIVPARLQPGEMVLNSSQQKKMFSMLENGTTQRQSQDDLMPLVVSLISSNKESNDILKLILIELSGHRPQPINVTANVPERPVIPAFADMTSF